MIAQDTGSAIRGPARADIYFGAGEEAGQMAGRVRQAGRFTMLLPNDLPFEATAFVVPLPRPRPAFMIPLRPPMIASSENLESKSGRQAAFWEHPSPGLTRRARRWMPHPRSRRVYARDYPPAKNLEP
jgi:hypothetical protein